VRQPGTTAWGRTRCFVAPLVPDGTVFLEDSGTMRRLRGEKKKRVDVKSRRGMAPRHLIFAR
jgi:hypothetical protein